MTRFNIKAFIVITALSAFAQVAYATKPPCSTSDNYGNTGCGSFALEDNLPTDTQGSYNTAMGMYALFANTTGNENTATGWEALAGNVSGNDNTASGYLALGENVTGSDNTATGYQALFSNVGGSSNTAVGYQTLKQNVSGGDNTAMGHDALENTTTGDTTAVGAFALAGNTTGTDNTAIGNNSLQSNTTGGGNTASGYWALQANNGNNNTAVGFNALTANKTGSNNIAMGYEASINVTDGSDNIDIGNEGETTDGVATNSGVIRIGTAGSQKEVFIAGISNSKITGSAVYVTAGGRLGVLASSERYKTTIAPMGSNTAKLEQLRPVTFKLKTDATGTRQYGLIAEEVAKVYPELVIRDEKGHIDGVRYDELAPMLLNEMQQQVAEIRELKRQLADIRAALIKQPSKDRLVAQR